MQVSGLGLKNIILSQEKWNLGISKVLIMSDSVYEACATKMRLLKSLSLSYLEWLAKMQPFFWYDNAKDLCGIFRRVLASHVPLCWQDVMISVLQLDWEGKHLSFDASNCLNLDQISKPYVKWRIYTENDNKVNTHTKNQGHIGQTVWPWECLHTDRHTHTRLWFYDLDCWRRR